MTTTSKVYLCGGINGLSDGECKDWREQAKSSLLCDTLDPMRRDYRGREDESVKEIIQGDIDDIAASDAILVCATRPSWGTAMEIVYAHQAGKPIVAFTGTGRVSPWLRGHCRIVETLEEAIAFLNLMVPAPPTRTEEPEKIEVRLREVIASTIAARDSAKDFWKIETHDELANFYRGQFSAYTSMVNYLERVVGELFPPERP